MIITSLRVKTFIFLHGHVQNIFIAKVNIMAETRYHITNGNFLVEESFSSDGLERLKAVRKINPVFKRRRIKDVLQMRPSEVEKGLVYFCR